MAASTFDIVNPATGEVVATVEHDTADEVRAAAGRARRAQATWAARPWRERAAVIRRFHDLVLERADLVLDTIQSESGKARRDALAEVVTVAGTARYYLAHGRGHLEEKRRRGGVPLLTRSRLAWRPHGLVGLITPWNFPFLLGVGDAIPALLAGNAVLTKASEATPRSALLARDLLVQAGLDRDLFAVLVGPGSELGPALIDEVEYVGFTGSTATGRIVAEAAARRLIPCSLELGGKNPMIVLPGVRVADAVQGLLSAAFANSGQTCICIERAYVHERVWDEFLAEATAAVEAMDVRWSTGFDADMGSLVGADHAAKVRAHLRDAIDKGARVVVGGVEPPDGERDAFVRPTLLVDVDASMELEREETFGPVVSLVKVHDADEAVRLANDSDLGLNASVWAGSRRAALEVARRLEVGTVNVNSSLLIYNSYDVPMGGIRRSGIGRRHGAAGIQRYCRQLSIVDGFQRGGGYELLLRSMDSPRRARLLLRVVALWRRVPGLR
jgi:succinate-semialdehyde dehydrogenase/glutarate-semialdehyde dehydrogenase